MKSNLQFSEVPSRTDCVASFVHRSDLSSKRLLFVLRFACCNRFRLSLFCRILERLMVYLPGDIDNLLFTWKNIYRCLLRWKSGIFLNKVVLNTARGFVSNFYTCIYILPNVSLIQYSRFQIALEMFFFKKQCVR